MEKPVKCYYSTEILIGKPAGGFHSCCIPAICIIWAWSCTRVQHVMCFVTWWCKVRSLAACSEWKSGRTLFYCRQLKQLVDTTDANRCGLPADLALESNNPSLVALASVSKFLLFLKFYNFISRVTTANIDHSLHK